VSDTRTRNAPALLKSAATIPSHVVVARARPLVARTAEAVTLWVPYAGRRLTQVGRLGAIGWALLACSVALTVAFVIPQRHEAEALRQQLSSTHAGSGNAHRSQEVSQFVAQLPLRSDLPRILAQMIEQSGRAGVQLESGRYEQVNETGGIARFRFSFPVKGSYSSISKFINGTLATIPAAGVDALRIERKSITEATVDADLRFIIFVRSTP
jgi:hypothetical protein